MSKEKGSKKGSKSFIVWILLFLLFVGIGIAGKMYLPSFMGHERTIDVETLKSEVKQINELASLQYDYRETIQNKGNGFFDKEFIATFDGRIKAGIDMENVKFEVQNNEKEDSAPVVKVTIPEAKILSHEDSNPKTIYEEGWSANGLGDTRNEEIKDAKEKKQKEFIKNGMLEDAKAKAEENITDFIHTLYGDDVVVEYEGIQK